jgi:hypothetical protein
MRIASNVLCLALLSAPFLTVAARADTVTECPFAGLAFPDEMPRTKAETMIAAAMRKPVTYSEYGNSLRGGVVRYEAAGCTLIGTYRPGAPAALLRSEDGRTIHRLPRDESVLEYKLESR